MGIEETEENRGSDGDPIFIRKTMCFKTEKFLVRVDGLTLRLKTLFAIGSTEPNGMGADGI